MFGFWGEIISKLSSDLHVYETQLKSLMIFNRCEHFEDLAFWFSLSRFFVNLIINLRLRHHGESSRGEQKIAVVEIEHGASAFLGEAAGVG